MRAAQLLSPTNIEIRDIAPPAPGPGEVLIETAARHLRSDVSFYQGRRKVAYPLTLGHELLGRVAAAGAGVSNFAPCQRVTVEPNTAAVRAASATPEAATSARTSKAWV